MLIDKIELSWFRGAAKETIFETDMKSVVLYGLNASGKSSFVDGIEYIIKNGRINHLRHEYSGSRLENSVRNTKAPNSEKSTVLLQFQDKNYILVDIESDCSFEIKSNPPELKKEIQNWELERHILRQDEVANFVHSTKGKKYSALLPLLGLSTLEEIAKNFNKLKGYVEDESEIKYKQGYYSKLKKDIYDKFETIETDNIYNKISNVAIKYTEIAESEPLESIVTRTIDTLERQINIAEPEIKKYYMLSQINNLKLKDKLNEVIIKEDLLRDIGDELIDVNISILEDANILINSIEDLTQKITCPLCGQTIIGDELKNHVEKELETLNEAKNARNQARIVRKNFLDTINIVKSIVEGEPTFTEWLQASEIAALIIKLQTYKIKDSRERLQEKDILFFNTAIPQLITFVLENTSSAPPTIDEIVKDLELLKLSAKVSEMNILYDEIKRLETLIKALNNSEVKVRNSIKNISNNILEDISEDIKKLWSKIHPNEPIENIKLHMPVDKAIDIGLKFYGLDQPSPRLTLSEGYRNCLGLCIFLALANRGDIKDHPIILDDIVSSFDREHRGMLVDVFIDDLSERQILLFTHDREWYSELRHRLPQKTWKFLALKPYSSPEIGIQWARSPYTFDDAKEVISIDPELAGNRIRAIMDTNMALVAESLKIQLPYLRGDKNDHRTCVEFLERLISEGKKRYKIKRTDKYEAFSEPIKIWKKTKNLLIAWGDRASHGGSLIEQEANKLIKDCEEAYLSFRCPSCREYVWRNEDRRREQIQCNCGHIKWKYG